MSLSRKLHVLRREAGGGGAAAEPSEAARSVEDGAPPSLRDRLARAQTRNGRPPGRRRQARVGTTTLAECLGGRVVAEGLVEVRTSVPLDAPCGRQPLAGLTERLPGLPDGAHLHPRQAVFLDTETTGLAGGTGTVVFMAGAGRVEEEALVVRQWVLAGFAGEAALMEQLAAFLGRAASVVTYNGKSFDVPLLKARARLAGVALELERLAHLDLLHPTRRAFRHQWPDCRLQTAEQRLLGRERPDDLPGAEAPGAWLALIRRGETERVHGVLEHNANDIVALAALWAALSDHPRGEGI